MFDIQRKNPPPDLFWRWVMSAGIKKKSLGQQPPRARAHRCTTTTSAHAHRAKILAFQHSGSYSKVERPLPSTNSCNRFDEYFPCEASKNHAFADPSPF